MRVKKLCQTCGTMYDGARCGCGLEPDTILSSRRWRTYTRPIVLHRDEHTCQRCGNPGNVVDHVLPIGTLVAFGLDPYDPAECQVLCASCSGKKDGPRAHVIVR